MEAEVHDLSCGGLGILVPNAVEPDAIAEADAIQIRLALPSGDDPILAVAVIVDRTLSESGRSDAPDAEIGRSAPRSFWGYDPP